MAKPGSIKLSVYHVFLMISSLLTVLDSVILIVRALNTSDQILLNPDGSLSLFLMLSMNVVRLSTSLLVFIVSSIYWVDYNKIYHIWLHCIYLVFVFVLLFSMGMVMDYQQCMWSLVLQVIHLYISMIYTFKLLLYHEDDSLDATLDFGRREADLMDMDDSSSSHSTNKTISMDPAKRTRYGRTLYFINKNLLAISTVAMIILSVLVAILLRQTVGSKPWSERNVMKLHFVGDLFIRVLLSLLVPLIATSLAYACTAFDIMFSGRIMCEMITYYLATTTLATVEGLIMVNVIEPGHRTLHQHSNLTSKPASDDKHGPILLEDTVLDMLRNIFTDSIFQSWITTYHTRLVAPSGVDHNQSMDDIDQWHITGEQLPGANVLSVVTFGLLVGFSANMLKTRGGQIICDLIEAINTITMMVTLAIVQSAPLGTFFLIVPQIITVDDLGDMFRLVAWFTFTVLLSLSVHCFVILSGLYLFVTRRNPYRFLGQMFPAISTAFATSSSSATMSVTMQCLEQNVHIPPAIVRFVIPFGSTVNMDGAALYESVAAIFVAQYRSKRLQLGEMFRIAITSIVVSIGAAGIPQAGMITTIAVLNSVGLSLTDAAYVMVVDFILDRFRTVVNVLGDAFGAAVISKRLRHVILHPTPPVITTPDPKQPSKNLITTTASKPDGAVIQSSVMKL